MFIPQPVAEAAQQAVWTATEDSPSAKWSSAIGIITAICGNILISFALNTQRYAHMRINRDHEDQEEKQRQKRRRRSGYGTQEERDAAEARAKANAKSSPTRYEYMDPEDSGETDPLIPSIDSLDRKKNAGDSSGTEDDGDDGQSVDEEENSTKRKSYLRSPIWWAGIVMMTLGETGNFLAYGFAPASIVSPLGVVALVSNCLIAPWLLHERFRWRDALGVVVAVAGCVTVVFSASTSNPKLTPNSIWHLITRWEFETYLGITIFLAIVLAVASNRFGEKSILIDLGLMGLFGGYTALSTKGVASLLSNTIWRTLTFPITYLLLAVLIFTAVMQIKYVNRALQRFNSTQVIPTQFVLFTLSVITGSAILYRDFERTSTEDAIKFVAGCALTFLGVWCITSGRNDESEDVEEDVDEEAIALLDEEGVQPEIRERQDADGLRQSLLPGSSNMPVNSDIELPLPNQAVDISPAQLAAIHAESASNLPGESFNTDDDKLKPPRIHATTSDPSIPTIGVIPAPTLNTPLKRGQSTVATPHKDVPATPAQPTQRPPALNPTPEPHSHPRLTSRNSVSGLGLIPGPLTSPLSSSLSAIVADSLRRGVDHFPTGSARRPTAARSRTTRPGAERIGPHAPPLKRHSIASGEMDLEHRPDTASSSRPSGGRIRSLSATLGDIFGTPKRRRAASQEDSPVQQRPQEAEEDS